MKQKLRKLQPMVYLLFIFVAWKLISTNYRLIVESFITNFPFVGLLFFLHLSSLTINAIYLSLMLKVFFLQIPLNEAFRLTVRSTTLNNLLPFRGGAGYRAIYLKENYNFSYASFTATLAGTYILTFASSGLLAVISYLLLSLTGFSISLFLFFFLLGFFLFFLLLLLIPVSKMESISLLPNKVIVLVKSWNHFKKNHKLMAYLLLIFSFNTLLGALIQKYQLKIINVDINYLQSVFLQTVAAVSQLVAVVPGGLGTTEISTSIAGATVNLNPELVVLSNILGRAYFYIFLVFLEGILLIYSTKKKFK